MISGARLTVAAVLSGAAAIMTWWTWGTWPDIMVDFGRELYVPWQLAGGKVLYRDIAYFSGPFSPYLNSLWFRLFGAHLWTLIACNLALLGVFVAVSYRMLRKVSCAFSATTACVIFVLLMGFGHHVGIGNYNFVCPYSHELTHGLLLSLGTLYCLALYLERPRPALVGLAGLGTGLAFLTKAEIFAALAPAVAAGLAAGVWSYRPGWRRAAGTFAVFAGAVAIGPLVAFGLLSLAMPADRALLGVLGSWPGTFNEQVTGMPFYRRGMGTDDVAASLLALLKTSSLYLALLVPAVLLGLAARRPGWWRPGLAVTVFAVVAVVGTRFTQEIPRIAIGRPLPLVLLLACVVLLLQLVRRWHDPSRSRRLILQCTLVLFALAALAKMILNARVTHYGFALATPGLLVLVSIMLDWLPAAVSRLGGYGRVVRGASLAGLAVVAHAYLVLSQGNLERKTYEVWSNSEMILTDRRGPVIQEALDELRRRLPPDGTLAVLPEGVMLNYLARRENPTPFVAFLPAEVLLFGEARMLEAFQASPPDCIVLVVRRTSEYGFRGFGEDYATELLAWILDGYTKSYSIAPRQMYGVSFGWMGIFERKDASPKAAHGPRDS